MYKEEFYVKENIRYLMEINGETIRPLAKEIGLSGGVISDLRVGKYETPNIKTLIKLCNHYKIDMETMLFTNLSKGEEIE